MDQGWRKMTMEQPPQGRSRPHFRNFGLGLLVAIALAVGLQPVFDKAWIPIVLGFFVGIIFVGGLTTVRRRRPPLISQPDGRSRPEPDQRI